jgi:hypothetical protein
VSCVPGDIDSDDQVQIHYTPPSPLSWHNGRENVFASCDDSVSPTLRSTRLGISHINQISFFPEVPGCNAFRASRVWNGSTKARAECLDVMFHERARYTWNKQQFEPGSKVSECSKRGALL